MKPGKMPVSDWKSEAVGEERLPLPCRPVCVQGGHPLATSMTAGALKTAFAGETIYPCCSLE